jgi:D-alanine-D-alanine ligase
MSRRVAVLMGGWSSEREVSLTSGRGCAAALGRLGYDVTTIDVSHDAAALVKALTPKPDVVFNALHGRFGEDGNIQGLLNILEIPYTHSGLLASAIAMDKPMTRTVLSAQGLRFAEGKVVHRADVLAGDVMARPYVIKPINEGSSVGVRIVRPGDNSPFDAESWPFGDEVLVERFIAGRELTVGVMGDRALGVTEIRPRQGFYDYAAKYTEGKAEHLIPAPIVPEALEEAKSVAVAAHRGLGCRGVSRADFRYDDTKGEPGELVLLEVNTQPGMTSLSLVPEQAAAVGISYDELVGWLVENASCDH